MSHYILRRLIAGFFTLLIASMIVFGVLELIPGDPAQVMLGINATQDALDTLREQMGLNEPVLTRYVSWVFGMLQGDFGISYTYSVPVRELIGERIMVSLPLALMALILSTLIAIPVAVFATSKRGKLGDVLSMGIAQIGIAIPNFWFALLLIYVFAVGLGLFPSGGFGGWSSGIWLGVKSLILPAIALALPQAAILSRVARSALIEVLNENYIRTARAKGLTRSVVLWRHALRNATIPILTILGLQFAFLIAGTLIIENVFYLPGLGRLIIQSIKQHDLIVVESVVMLLVAMVIFVNLIVDLSYGLVDPRLRAKR
ncbi:MAG: ABC transporter permease [Nitratireductor sp.]